MRIEKRDKLAWLQDDKKEHSHYIAMSSGGSNCSAFGVDDILRRPFAPAAPQQQAVACACATWPPPFTFFHPHQMHFVPAGIVDAAAWSGRQGKRKGGQVRFTSAQSALLERRFAQAQYLSPEQRRTLAETLGLSERQIKTWFQNRRAKCRRATPDHAPRQPHPAAQTQQPLWPPLEDAES